MKCTRVLTTVVLTLAVFGHGYNQTRRAPSRQEGAGSREVISGHAAREIVEVPKGEALVEKLPQGVEGLEMKDGVVKIRPGYKFEKKENKVTVMRAAGGGTAGGRVGVGGAWSCVCKQGAGGCSTMVEDNQIFCAPGGEPACSDKCVLSVVIKAAKSQIFIY